MLPGTLPAEVLADRLAATDPAVVMKLGRTFDKVRERLRRRRPAGRGLVRRARHHGQQRILPLAEVDPETVPYFSLAVLPSRVAPPVPAAPSRPRPPSSAGEVVVVGLGPAGPLADPRGASGELAAADELVGYTTYLDRVPVNPRQRRHASDNQVESERAAFALDLAKRGAGWSWCPPATPACSRWPAPCWRSPARSSGATSTSGSAPA